jgi:hypothetical protein
MSLVPAQVGSIQNKLLTAVIRTLCVEGEQVPQLILVNLSGEIERVGYLPLPDSTTAEQAVVWQGDSSLIGTNWENPACCDCGTTPTTPTARFYIENVTIENIQQLGAGNEYLTYDLRVNYVYEFGGTINYLWKTAPIDGTNYIAGSSTDQVVSMSSSGGDTGGDYVDIELTDGTRIINARVHIWTSLWDYVLTGHNLTLNLTSPNMDLTYEAGFTYNSSAGDTVTDTSIDMSNNAPPISVIEPSNAPINILAQALNTGLEQDAKATAHTSNGLELITSFYVYIP